MPDLSLETKLGGNVCGIDEVGRGPLAGPVVTACVYIPPETYNLPFWAQVTDSKQVSEKKRGTLAPLIREHTIWAYGMCSVDEIDRINILQATLTAMQRAFDSTLTKWPVTHALVDGNRAPKLSVPVMTVIKGDALSLSIAAASIIAKVERDRIMRDLHTEFPMYGWARNAGYGTAEHLAALTTHGPCPHHRQSFAPVRAATLTASSSR